MLIHSPINVPALQRKSYGFIYSFIFTPTFPLGRVAAAVAPGVLEIPHGFQQPLIAPLALHQNRTKKGRICNHTTWSLVNFWAAFPWI